MKTFTVNIDDKLDLLLDELKEDLGKVSRAEVFRLSIALLKMARDAKAQNNKVTIADQNDKVVKEILIPG